MKALILIDIQEGFNDPFWGPRNNPHFEKNVERILSQWRHAKAPVIHVQHLSKEDHSPLRPDSFGVHFMKCAQPQTDEPIFQKSVHSAFIGTSLFDFLKTHQLQELVLIGLTSDHCVSTTARMAFDLGFDVTIFSNAVATFNRQDIDGTVIPAETIQKVSLASLNKEFAKVQPFNLN